jgi:pimeloyl-ACP methyl ester carboxylesterase
MTGAEARRRLLAGLPVRQRRVDAGGVSTALLEGGAGSPLLLLHGGIECGGAYWAPVIPRLVENHRVVVPDAPGLGESEPLARLDDETFAHWLRDLIRLTCDARPTLVAHSLFGTGAALFAAAHGDSLSRLIVYAAPGIGRYRMPLRLRIVAVSFALRPNERSGERFERFALADRELTRRRDPAWFDAFSAYVLSRARVPHVKRTMRALVKAGTRRVPDPELQRIGIPAALLWGRHDRMTPLPLAEAASTRLGWPLHVVDDAAHVPHIEQPGGFVDRLAEALRTEGCELPLRAKQHAGTTAPLQGTSSARGLE